MSKRNGNFCARQAARFTGVAHQRMPAIKWAIVLLLALAWLAAGLLAGRSMPPTDALYQTLGALTMAGGLETAAGDFYRDVARFAGVALTAVGLLFGFSGAVGRAIARLWLNGSAGHVAIGGEGPAALALARSCRKAGDGVVLIARDLAPETAWSLRQSGVVLVEGDPTHVDMLRSARAGAAAHVVALTGDDAENLRMEAALRVAAEKPRRKPLAAHIAIDAPLLLQEARQMRAAPLSGGGAAKARIDPRPFSLDEIAARALLVGHGAEMLDLAERQGRERLHLVTFGFDAGAEAVAVRALMSLWSARFGEPRITVVAPDAARLDAAFAARYPQARAHDVWRADIAFLEFDWAAASLDGEILEKIADGRGAPTAAIVSTGADGQNIQLAFALMRAANRSAAWAAPVFMKEGMQSEFSRQHSGGDRTARLDAYLTAFGAVEETATRDWIVEGRLDSGAAIAHRVYEADMAAKSDVDTRALEAMRKSWNDVAETYRNANRASADSALVKLWDAGWRPARPGERGLADPQIDGALLERLSEVEHARWVAERLISGWRPAATRDNRLMIHPDLVPWSALTPEQKTRDGVQVRAAALTARALHPQGFVRR